MTTAQDPMHGCCEIETEEGRCHYPGVWNTSTSGGGKWLCRRHSGTGREGMSTADIIIQSHRDHPNPDWSLEARRNASNKGYSDKWGEQLTARQVDLGGNA